MVHEWNVSLKYIGVIVIVSVIVLVFGTWIMPRLSAGMSRDHERDVAKLNNASATDVAFDFVYASMYDCQAELRVCSARTRSIIPSSGLSVNDQARALEFVDKFRWK